MEKLYQLHTEGGFDLVVVDTPPTRDALDFLDAPRRLYGFLENRIFRLLLMPTRAYLRAMTIATQALLKTISKVAGAEIVEDAVAFFRAFEGMEDGFRERARRVEALLADTETAFLLVAAPRRDSVDEARYFTKRLAEGGLSVAALVVNRLHPDFERAGAVQASSEAGPPATADGPPASASGDNEPPDPDAWAELVGNLADFAVIVDRETDYVGELNSVVAPAPVVAIAYLRDDVHDLDGLELIASYLRDPASVR